MFRCVELECRTASMSREFIPLRTLLGFVSSPRNNSFRCLARGK